MPIYEYRCTACDHELEALRRFADPQLTTCPVCGKETLTKQLSAAGFQLKGSGWYATDFKNSGAKPAAKAKTASKGTAPPAAPSVHSTAADAKALADSTTTSASESKSDSKPATETKSVVADKPSGTTGSSTAKFDDAPRTRCRRRETLPHRRAAGVGAAGHHAVGPRVFLVSLFDQVSLLLLPGERAPRSARRLPHSGARRRCSGLVLSVAIVLHHRRRSRPTFFGARLIRVWEGAARTHSCGQVDLFERQASQRYAALRFPATHFARRCWSNIHIGEAGRSHSRRAPPRSPWRENSMRNTSAFTCRPRPIRPQVFFSCCRVHAFTTST